MRNQFLTGLFVCSTGLSANINVTQLEWMVINDTVMGGVSRSNVIIDDDMLTFKGNLSLENNGGFASFRAPISFAEMQVDNLKVKVLGDGKRYQLRLRVDGYYDGPAFVYSFATKKGVEQELQLNEKDFVLMYRGRTLVSDYQFNFNDVRSLGFMIGGKQEGLFELAVKQMAIRTDKR